MNFITTNLQLLTSFFAGVATLAVLVAGFFIGRSWLREMGMSEDEKMTREWKRHHDDMNKLGL